MRKQRGITEFRLDWTNDLAIHIAFAGEIAGRNVDLVTVASSVLDGCAIDHPVDARPQDRSHTHRARFASRVKTVTPEEMIFDPSTSKPDRIHFRVTSWIVFLRGLIDGSHQHLTGLRIYDHGPKWYGRIRCQGSFSESDQADHLLLIKGRAFVRLEF